MPTKLVVVGPFEVPTKTLKAGKRVDAKKKTEFWRDSGADLYRRKHGLYVFAIRAGKGFKPWYVGKTSGTKGLEQEIFTPHKLDKYGDALADTLKGTPVFFFVVPTGTKRVIPKQVLKDAETFFIQQSKAKNPSCSNQHKAKLPDWVVGGVLRHGAGNPGKTAQQFSKMMGMN